MYDVPPASSRVARCPPTFVTNSNEKQGEKCNKIVCKIMLDVYAAALGHIEQIVVCVGGQFLRTNARSFALFLPFFTDACVDVRNYFSSL